MGNGISALKGHLPPLQDSGCPRVPASCSPPHQLDQPARRRGTKGELATPGQERQAALDPPLSQPSKWNSAGSQSTSGGDEKSQEVGDPVMPPLWQHPPWLQHPGTKRTVWKTMGDSRWQRLHSPGWTVDSGGHSATVQAQPTRVMSSKTPRAEHWGRAKAGRLPTSTGHQHTCQAQKLHQVA